MANGLRQSTDRPIASSVLEVDTGGRPATSEYFWESRQFVLPAGRHRLAATATCHRGGLSVGLEAAQDWLAHTSLTGLCPRDFRDFNLSEPAVARIVVAANNPHEALPVKAVVESIVLSSDLPISEHEIVVASTYRFRMGEMLFEADPEAIGSWAAYKRDQTIELNTDRLLLQGRNGGGLSRKFSAAELGLQAGDFVYIEADVESVTPSDMLSIDGDFICNPALFSTNRGENSWHSLLRPNAYDSRLSIVGRLVGSRFKVFLYSENETSMSIKRVRMFRLTPSSPPGATSGTQSEVAMGTL